MSADLLTFLHHSHVPACTARVDKHFDAYHTLQMMTQGDLIIAYDDDAYRCQGWWAWPAYPGPHIRFHTARDGDSWHHRHVAFHGPRVQAWRAAGIWPRRPQPLSEDSPLIAMMDDLQTQLERGDRWSGLRACNILEAILIELAAQRQARQIEPWLTTALAELDAVTTLRPDCPHIAARCGLGPVAFQRRFKQQMGCSPTAFVRQRRIARAQQLLLETNHTLATIAEKLGYADQYYFARHFRQTVGVTPGRYRSSAIHRRP